MHDASMGNFLPAAASTGVFAHLERDRPVHSDEGAP
jgi:hypothetical protein